ncbi:50S ribosomal protein P1 [Candidatus Woesearchaeota archaeon]|nr:50S ribosomal protein P1 [Candidatus Woesearchaeota archaeon]
MEYIYCAMLLHKAGKKINEEAMEKVLTAAGVTPDKAKIKATVAALADADIDKVLKEAAVAPVAAAPTKESEEKGKEKKEEEKEEDKEKSEEEAAAGLGALFG